MPVVEQTPERYLRSPKLEAAADGGALLHVLAWAGDEEFILRFNLADNGSVQGEPVATDHGLGARHASSGQRSEARACGGAPWLAR